MLYFWTLFKSYSLKYAALIVIHKICYAIVIQKLHLPVSLS